MSLENTQSNIIEFPGANFAIFTEAKRFRKFCLHGRAEVAAISAITGKEIHFVISRERYRDVYHVNTTIQLRGSTFQKPLGQLCDKNGIIFKHAPGMRADIREQLENSIEVKAFKYIWKHIIAGNLPPKTTLKHRGKCGRCHRRLTDPASMQRGVGPECVKHKTSLKCA
jgi:hypothetical protein